MIILFNKIRHKNRSIINVINVVNVIFEMALL